MRRAQVDFTTESLSARVWAAAAIAQVARETGFRPTSTATWRGTRPVARRRNPTLIRRLWAAAAPAWRFRHGGRGAGDNDRRRGTRDTARRRCPVVLTAAVIVATAPIGAKGLRALWHGRRVTIDLLMTIAAVGALTIGERWEALTVVVLFTIGEVLEGLSAERACALAAQPSRCSRRPRHSCARTLRRTPRRPSPTRRYARRRSARP